MNMANGGSAKISPDEWERIARYLTGEASSAEAEATKAWIGADRHRVELVALLESVLANVAHEDSRDVDVEGALTKVKSRFDEARVIPFTARPAVSGRPILFPFLRVAAAAVIVFVATIVWQNIRRSSSDVAGRTFATSVGERRQIVLEDGTRVLLGPTSRLVVTPRGLSADRLVTLDGIGYFSVVHDPQHPFTVRAGSISIQDVGTAFSVET
ncbi:MAG: FecR domain-containing protein, partial [Gemmatimonadaceae bacterium]